MVLWVLLAFAGGCAVNSDDFVRPATVPPVDLGAATAPATASPSGEKLFQVLYAGEVGEAAAARGQRVRVRAWLDVMAFTDEQTSALRALVRDVKAKAEDERRYRARVDGLELAALTPVYNDLEKRLAAPEPMSEEEAGAFASKLEAARAAVYGDEDPRAAQLARVRALLDTVAPFVSGLSHDQQEKLTTCRFFLAKRANPILDPADYQALVGMDWDGGDFSAVSSTEAPEGQSHMDLGGLWSIEHLRAPPKGYLVKRQLEGVLVMALLEPALAAVLDTGDASVATGP